MIKNSGTQLILFILSMVAYVAIMCFGIFYGSEYPKVFFWAMMALTVFVFVTQVGPKVKDAKVLGVGLLILGVTYGISEAVADHCVPNSGLANLLIKVCINTPVFFPVWKQFMKTIGIRGWEQRLQPQGRGTTRDNK